MVYLLDTHIVLWWVLDDQRLSHTARSIIAETPRILVSVVSLWEVIIKARLGKLQIDPQELYQAVTADGFVWLAVQPAHVLTAYGLTAHHKDPFDHLLIAQSAAECGQLVTADQALIPYAPQVRIV